MEGEYLGIAALLVAAGFGRHCAVRLSARPNVFVGWAGAALGGAAAFLAGLCLFAPLVVDPGMVAVQLPLLGAAVGSVVEIVAQAARYATGRTTWRAAAWSILAMATVGAAAVGGLAVYSSWMSPPKAA